jgi:hypothetical protein
MAECAQLHTFARTLPRHRVPFDAAAIPADGLYLLFEKGESAHAGERIVRAGTHTGKGQLPSRLRQHFLTENKDRSIFRKNIGRALLTKADDPFLSLWEIDLTPKAARDRWSGKISAQKLAEVEREVTAYMHAAFSFAVLAVEDPRERLALESKIISTLSLCEECRPSAEWLGNHSPKEKIRGSGLWLVNELYKTPLSSADLVRLTAL